MISLPYPMIEMSNGILLILFGYMAAFAYFHLISKWSQARSVFRGHGGWARAAFSIYHDNKAAVAHTVFVTGLLLRTVPLWYLRHALDHHIPVSGLVRALSLPTLWFGTLLIVLGSMCWIRVVSPFRNRMVAWTLMVSFAIAFAYLMAV